MTINAKFICLLILLYLGGCAPNIQVSTKNNLGVLVLAHGGDENWNREVKKAIEPLWDKYLIEIAYGMAVPKNIQNGIHALEKKGAKKIIAVPLFVSSFSPIIRQTEYLLGLRPELVDEPIIMNNQRASKSLKPIKTKANIVMTNALDDHPLVGEILLERAMELSQSPKTETAILVAHGPNGEKDNRKWLNTMNNLAKQVNDKGGFKAVLCVTLRDDAPQETYNKAKQHFRKLVIEKGKDGKVIVVPLLLASGGIEKGIPERLEGLEYIYNGKTLLPHKNITKFVEQSILSKRND